MDINYILLLPLLFFFYNFQVEFKFRLGWALGRADSSANWTAVPMNGGPSFAVGSVGYIQTATNTAEKWEQGEKTFTYDFTTIGPYRVR